MGQALGGMVGQQGQSQSQPAAGGGAGAGGGGGSFPSVMTPSEAAQILRVSEEDVMGAIEAGDLRARKLGSAYRISKSELEEFLG